MTTDDVISACSADARLSELVDGFFPDPVDQARLFRCRLRTDGSECVLKVGVDAMEQQWMAAISATTDDTVVPVLDHGRLAVDGTRWLLMPLLVHRPRSDRPTDARGAMAAVARFHRAALGKELPTYPIDLEFARTWASKAIEAGCPGPTARLQQALPRHARWLDTQADPCIGHGDAHFGNLVGAAADGPWRLIDPIPRRAHWAWDAAYSAVNASTPGTPDLVDLLAWERAERGLPTDRPSDRPTTRAVLLSWASVMWWPLMPHRHAEDWWGDLIEQHVTDGADVLR